MNSECKFCHKGDVVKVKRGWHCSECNTHFHKDEYEKDKKDD